ncbi:hypothetical protein J2Z83_000759 [Virgibacillus natechei]|uniref:Uncharacterized protein n=1 Tax=Virgibacillus natechei TaxID=1216297 RepID=A0ABS4ICJ6_9BACI|nr:hypothetical protein [Virgibacillus natechei]
MEKYGNWSDYEMEIYNDETLTITMIAKTTGTMMRIHRKRIIRLLI